ncbi:restriction endonuclease subunit S [Phocaeicola vulgatus]|uniref:restriction endonuclease subunit S n=1 Tax=Phocaeicola vulgatus TaxID=821 RepID=UPI001C38F5D9|nr:restriction endonuclease subunit S [Phocaeicola vulgatus]MBV3851194.1 restriction endonuclease subunit S [Phocaeicola vulgatus]MBV3860256.1 restriction endonuclease subunit S [Phocaeicola vulgatus]MBV3864288.1 restriction endonuclease subunit S [Phocaeicola vulgatus]MBV3871904.1 restriction endonuclease subunit S [Phocaeicola vulgatus]MBV3889370.1 restriction endonuclease subunit S [Phocaeicola vulgatus]
MRFPEFSGEWNKYTINDLATVVGGGTPDTTVKSYWGGDIQWFTPSEIGKNKYVDFSKRTITRDGLDNSSAKLLPLHTILLSSRATVGECSIASNECTTNQGFQSLIAKQCNIDFLYYLIQTKKKDLIRNACGSTFLEISANEIRKIKVAVPVQNEQEQIAKLLSLIDERIATQNKIIEDLKKLKSAIIHRCYSSQTNMIPLSELLKQCSDRNRSGSDLQVLSVSNKYGFIAQSNQFEDREVASDDTSNYKVVKKGMFAYNPARINVGSIALYEMDGNGIVSPMYVCFTTKSELLPSYLKYYFASQTFKHEMYKRLEGSVRLCLTFEELCNIEIHLPSIEQQKNISKYISKIENNLSLVDSIFSKYQQQRRYLLSQMFI